jgi:hypothetical protein
MDVDVEGGNTTENQTVMTGRGKYTCVAHFIRSGKGENNENKKTHTTLTVHQQILAERLVDLLHFPRSPKKADLEEAMRSE